METQKPHSLTTSERNAYHERLMISILRNLSDTPLVLKGGTALYLGYGLNRFSEDLDFDSAKKLNLLNKIQSAKPQGISIDNINVKKDTDTVSRYLVNYTVNGTGHKDALKLEISYRTPVPDEQVTIKDGIRFSSIERIIDNKLNAAFDGENTRTKGRDLFDLHFLAKNYAEYFTEDLAQRLKGFAQDPDKLVALYSEDIDSDPLLNKITDIEGVALELNQMAEDIYSKCCYQEETIYDALMRANQNVNNMSEDEIARLMAKHSAFTYLFNKDNSSLYEATNNRKNNEEKLETSNKLKFKP